MEKHKRLDQLRAKWRNATPEGRKLIEQEVALLKEVSEYQCYFEENGERCKNRQQECWCSDAHRIAWQESNYIDKRSRGEHKLSIEEIQRRLREMKPSGKI